MPHIGVILSGCGVFDGAEIHEAVMTLLCLDRNGATYQCMAPDRTQMHVINHVTGQPDEGESRNVLIESARIARGQIIDIAAANVDDYDGFVIPGGFGAAKNLCDFATQGPGCEVVPDVFTLLREAHRNRKPLAFLCIAPAIAAKIFGEVDVSVTIGHDPETAAAIEKMGAVHCRCDVDQYHVDEKNKIISTPAYMEGKSIKEVYAGISEAVKALVAMSSKAAV